MKKPFRRFARVTCDEAPCPNPALIGPCHVFRGAKNSKGYGCVGFRGGQMLVHRYLWEREVGPIPPGLLMDHQCRVRACCNVDHLRLVTPKINALENNDGVAVVNAAKRLCPRGHKFTPENTRRDSHGDRECWICHRQQRRKERKKARLTKRLTKPAS